MRLKKFEMLKRYGFEVKEMQIPEAILHPDYLEERGNHFFATKIIDLKHALRVVYENRKDFLVVITFYPVRREPYDL